MPISTLKHARKLTRAHLKKYTDDFASEDHYRTIYEKLISHYISEYDDFGEYLQDCVFWDFGQDCPCFDEPLGCEDCHLFRYAHNPNEFFETCSDPLKGMAEGLPLTRSFWRNPFSRR